MYKLEYSSKLLDFCRNVQQCCSFDLHRSMKASTLDRGLQSVPTLWLPFRAFSAFRFCLNLQSATFVFKDLKMFILEDNLLR